MNQILTDESWMSFRNNILIMVILDKIKEPHSKNGWHTIKNKNIKFHIHNNQIHNINGPSIIYEDKYVLWCLNNKNISFDEYVQTVFPEESPEKTLFLLNWSK